MPADSTILSGRRAYRRVADTLREEILTGARPPGSMLESVNVLIRRFGVSRETIRAAFGVLRREGLIYSRQGVGAWAREIHPRENVSVEPGATVIIRMPTDPERRDLHIEEGIPVFVLRRLDGRVTVLAADRFDLVGPQRRPAPVVEPA